MSKEIGACRARGGGSRGKHNRRGGAVSSEKKIRKRGEGYRGVILWREEVVRATRGGKKKRQGG